MRPSARLAPRERTRRRASLRAPAASIDFSTATIARPWQTIFFRAARPTSPRSSPASQAASWQTAGTARGSGKRDSQSDTSVSPRRFRSDADVITSRRLKTRWETRAPWTGAIVIPAIRRRARIGGQRYASDFCCALPRTAARRSKAATGAATASTCSLQLGLACGCSGAARRAAAAASIAARERTRQRTVPVSRRDLGASWCRTRPITRYAAAVMRSFQTVFCFVRHVWYGANTFPLRILYGLR